MLFHSEDMEIYLKPHSDDSERFRLCEKPGIQIGNTFKTACVFTKDKTDSSFDIVIRFGESFKLGSANVIQVDVRAGKGQTNHCFEDTAVFGIQTSWVHGQQHVISSFKANAYDQTCCPDLEAQGAGKPIPLPATPEDVGEGSRETNWAFLIRPMQDEQGKDTTPGNITVYVTRGMVTWDPPDEVDHNPAEQRVCSPKNMARFKALPGQEGDPYIAEFRPLDYSKKPIFWMETYANGELKMKHGSKRGLIVQPNAEFTEDRKRTHDRRQHMSSEWETRKAVELQKLHGGGDGRRTTRSSSGGNRPETQSTEAQGDDTGDAIVLAPYTERRSEAKSSTMQPDDPEESLQTEALPQITFCDCPKDHTSKQHSKSGMARLRPRPIGRSKGPDLSPQTPTADLIDRCKPCRACGKPKVALKDRDNYKRQMQMDLASQRDGHSQTGTPRKKKGPSAPTTAQHSQEPEATENPARRSRGFFARFANGRDSSSDEGTLPAIPQKRKLNYQARKQRNSPLGPETSPGFEVPIAAQQQSPEASSSHDGGETPNLDHRSGTQANPPPRTADSGSQNGDDDEESPIQLARDSSFQSTKDSAVQVAEDSRMQDEEEEPLSHVSGGNTVLNRGDPQPVHESAIGHLMQRAATANMTSGVSDANSQIGLGTHPIEVSNPHEATTSSQQTHLSLGQNFNEAMRAYAESLTQKADATLGLPTSASYTGHDRQGYPTGAPQQQLDPTSNQHNDNNDGQHKQAHSRSSIDHDQTRQLEQYATPAPSDGHQHRKDSVAPDQRTIANTPAPPAESARTFSKRPAPQRDVIDLTNSDDESPSAAIKRPAEETAMDSDERKREIEKRRAAIQRTVRRREIENRKLEIEEEVLDLEDEDALLISESFETDGQLRAGHVVKSEPSGIVKSEQ
ncbi:hypothetical protein KC354_g2835 [Hortaea werneckii]|nr:hypothetical protein KC354_g2835 [Hortaea werneckii]